MFNKNLRNLLNNSGRNIVRFLRTKEVPNEWIKYKKSLVFGGTFGSLLLYDFTVREGETIGELNRSKKSNLNFEIQNLKYLA